MLTPYFNIAYVKILLRVFWAKVQRDLLRGKSGRSYIPYSKIAYVKILRLRYGHTHTPTERTNQHVIPEKF